MTENSLSDIFVPNRFHGAMASAPEDPTVIGPQGYTENPAPPSPFHDRGAVDAGSVMGGRQQEARAASSPYSGMKKTNSQKKNLRDRLILASVAQLFLDIFKLQLKAPESAPARHRAVESTSSRSDYTYELSVKMKGGFEKRRMSVGFIGETSGSRSRCFKVSYDDILVIKIPPVPIKGFYDYISKIQSEKRIADKHSDKIQFITPAVSALLKRVHTFYNEKSLTPLELEDRYIQWLERHPEFHEYLKINGGFVFFMDLSTNIFFGRALENLHEASRTVKEKIKRHPNPLWDSRTFASTFGIENMSVRERMNHVYSVYEQKADELLKTNKLTSISQYELRKWFLIYLSGDDLAPHAGDLPEEVFHGLKEAVRETIKDHFETVMAYREIVREHVRDLNFIQNKPPMAGIITNILELLASLNQAKAAIRDLKPDNIFVAGDMEKYPHFLKSAETYSMGLIDLETAVAFDAGGGEPIEQPLLGGTPSYATPSHLFSNKVLQHVYNDLPRLFLHQDWHAGVAMIYETVMGRRLFEKTRKLLPRIRVMAQASIAKNKSLPEVIRDCNRFFWRSASEEFNARVRKNSRKLSEITIDIPGESIVMLKENLRVERDHVVLMIRRAISESAIKSDRGKKLLLMSSFAEIRREREKREAQIRARGGSAETSPVIKLFKHLETLKSELSVLDARMKRFNEPDPRISTHGLLRMMFTIVMISMYSAHWGRPGDMIL
ncbi:MAG: hypothetical protein GY859_42895 [Desulfobacterales bacterium]|nr:hypothetical protein [Desulfobacterales bacterium]